MKTLVACIAFATGFTATAAHAQFGASWQRTPAITVVGPEGDPRHALVDEAVAFWNTTLEDLGSGFRLGPVTGLVRPVPEDDLRSLGESSLAGQRGGCSGSPTRRSSSSSLCIRSDGSRRVPRSQTAPQPQTSPQPPSAMS